MADYTSSNTAGELVHRTDPATGKEVSLLGFGCMRLPLLPDEQTIDQPLAQQMVDYAVAHGVNYFDTAWPYHGGQSEGFIGQALRKYPRGSYLLADKLPTWEIQCEADVDRYFDYQLERCGVDYFDYYLVHNLCAEHWVICQQHNIFERLLEKKRQGKIGRLGFSMHATPEVLTEILAAHDWDFVQIQLNYLDWEMQEADRLYELINARGLPVIVMEPIRGGSLATLSAPARMLLRAEAPGKTPASLALRFAASLPGVLTVLSGMSAPEQVYENIATMSSFTPLVEEEYSLLERVRAAYLSAGTIPCTGCRYCEDCPSGVDIARTFEVFNQFQVQGAALSFARSCEYLGEKGPSGCVDCGFCVTRCPQRIDIPKHMREIAARLAEIPLD